MTIPTTEVFTSVSDWGREPPMISGQPTDDQKEVILTYAASFLEPRFVGQKSEPTTVAIMRDALNYWVDHWIRAGVFPENVRGMVRPIFYGTNCVLAWGSKDPD